MALGIGVLVLALDQVLGSRFFAFSHNAALRAGLRQPLEERFGRVDVGDGRSVTGVITLGGGDVRIQEAGRLARQWPHIRVVMCDLKQSVALLGDDIDPARVILESASRTTWENAVFARDLVKPKPGERWLLVTSAMHMPRAMGAFRKAGFEVEPWPVEDLPENLLVYNMVRHEWLGLLGYAVRGRSSALFPGP